MLSRSSRTPSAQPHRYQQSVSEESRFSVHSQALSHSIGSASGRSQLSAFDSSVIASLRSMLGPASSHDTSLSSSYAPSSQFSSYAPRSFSYASRSSFYASPTSFGDPRSSSQAPTTLSYASHLLSNDPYDTSTLPEAYAPLFYVRHHSSLASGSQFSDQVTSAGPQASLRSPDVFTGRDPTKLIPFISQCLLWFTARPYSFSTQRDSVLFASSYLRGPAISWWMTILAKFPPSPLVDNWYLFSTELIEMFGDRNLRQTAQRALQRMKMPEDSSVTRYIVTFNSYVPYAGWNDAACTTQFYRGLPDRLKDMFQYVPRPQTLADMQNYVMEFDRRHWERRADEEFAPSEYNTSAPPSPSLSQQTSSLSSRSPSLWSQTSLSSPQTPSLWSPPSHSLLTTPILAPTRQVPRATASPIIFAEPHRSTASLTPTHLEGRRRRQPTISRDFCGTPGHSADHCPQQPSEHFAHGVSTSLEPPLPFGSEEELF
jgi:hypothetical protein